MGHGAQLLSSHVKKDSPLRPRGAYADADIAQYGAGRKGVRHRRGGLDRGKGHDVVKDVLFYDMERPGSESTGGRDVRALADLKDGSTHDPGKGRDPGDGDPEEEIPPAHAQKIIEHYGKKDIEAVVKAGVDVIRMPKTETAEEVIEVEREIEKVEKEIGCLGRTQIMAAIESALGVVNAYAIATASKRMMGIALGAEDYSANLKTQRTPEGSELLLARETIVVAARAAGIDALDTVYSNLNDMETFRNEVEAIKKLGFDGKSIINPRQIEVVNEVFAPKEKDIQKSLTILAAIKEAEKKGSGVIAVNGKMVDRPVVLRAQRTIDLAIASGILTKEDIQ